MPFHTDPLFPEHDLDRIAMIARVVMTAMVAVIVFSSSVAAHGPDIQLTSFLSGSLRDITALIQQDPTGSTVEAALEQRKVYDQIWLYLSNSIADDGLGPNPERDRRVAFVERALDQYQPALISAFRGQIESGASSGRVFNVLEYSRASATLKATLKEIIASPAAKSPTVVQAYDLMFRQQLEDAADKQLLIKLVQLHFDRSSAADVAKELIGKASTVWALEDMMPLYQEWLSLPYSKASVPKGRGMQTLANLYAAAADGLMAFGSTGADLLPLLSLRLEELSRADDEHSHSTANLLQQAIDVVAGRTMPRQCGNSKGKYLGVSRAVIPAWKAAHAEARAKTTPSGDHSSSASQSPASGPIKSPPTLKATDAKLVPTTQEPISSTPWSIVAVLLVAMISLLWSMLKNRK